MPDSLGVAAVSAATRNPYDFANPVSDPKLFIGRNDELRDIKYYLDQGAVAPRAINIALLGARAAGKTSFLNIIEHEAALRGFCVARVDLNEGDADSQLNLFFKIFDSVLTSVCEQPRTRPVPGEAPFAFGGKHGAVYDAYTDMISAYDVPKDATLRPFVFPVQYAKAMSAGRYDVRVSDQSYRKDLLTFREEVGRPIILLFDECNVLSGRRVLLEMLRNVFMNTPGYMLVFTGTPDLFPVMDEVFSPIVRQFKKIDVGPFARTEDTEKCIRKPLESVGISEPSSIFDPGTLRELYQVHKLTGGRPYEIQLLCHLMFRRVQRGEDSHMRLTLEVLDDVLRELARGHDLGARPVISAVRTLTSSQLALLGQLTLCNSHATFEQIAFAEQVFHGRDQAWHADAAKQLAAFEKDGILSVDHGILRFSGDEFDRLYTKYYAQQANVGVPIAGFLYEAHIGLLLSTVCFSVSMEISQRDIQRAWRISDEPQTASSEIGAVRTEPAPRDTFQIVLGLTGATNGHLPHASYSAVARELYGIMLNHWLRGESSMTVARIALAAPGIRTAYVAYTSTDESVVDIAGRFDIANATAVFEKVSKRAADLGGELEASFASMSVYSPSEIVAKLPTAGQRGEKVRQHMGRLFATRIQDTYLNENTRGKALELANAALDCTSDIEALALNNLGYVLIVAGQIDRAIQAFQHSAKVIDDPDYAALPHHNLGIALALTGCYGEAVASWRHAVDLARPIPSEERTMASTLKLTRTGSELALTEELNGDLLRASEACIALTQDLAGNQGLSVPVTDLSSGDVDRRDAEAR